MNAFPGRTVAVFSTVALGCISIGCVGAVVGVPGNYGLTTAQAVATLDQRPVTWTVGWVVYSVIVLLLALARARHIARQWPWVRRTLGRGSVWLWAGIGLPWFYVWTAWDLQLNDFYPLVTPTRPLTLGVAVWWWLGSGVCLVIAIVWSAWTVSRAEPDTPTTLGSSPQVDGAEMSMI